MSPKRPTPRPGWKPPRDRKEVAVAVLAGLAVVGGTALAILIIRPGGPAGRQPRIAWDVGVALFVVIVALNVINGEGKRRLMPSLVAVAGIGVAAGIVALLWPGGVVRHKTIPTTPTLPPASSSSTPGPPSSTPLAPVTPSTPAPGNTAAAPPTTTPG